MRYSILIVPYLVSFQLFGQINIPDSLSNKQIFLLDQEETLNKQLSQFEGKIIYADLWSTWCKYCIASFKYKKDLDEFFESNDIVFLGLCIDKVKSLDNWKNLIYKHSVNGYHVFVDYETLDDYKSDLEMSRRNKKLLGEGFPH